MAGPSRNTLATQAIEAIARFQAAADVMDEAAAQYMGLARTEIRCLAAVRRGPVSASELADRLHLTRGAITALVDRLEARNLVERQPVSDDRRRVHIAITPLAEEYAARIYGPLVAEGYERARSFTDEQLTTITDFLAMVRDLQLKHAERVRTDGGNA